MVVVGANVWSEKDCLKQVIDDAEPEMTTEDVEAVVELLLSRGKRFIRSCPELSNLYLQDD